MCGITGILKLDRTERVSSDVVRRMCDSMVHRGPDDEGVYAEGNVGLGMRRLSIIDLATGHQPLSNEDGSVWIVFNGEIYNQASLREQLTQQGHTFRSQSDTEVIIHLYEEHGHDCVQHLRGMFAFAIWDGYRRTLFAARDRLGIKPLYYHVSEKIFTFASEIKALFAHPALRVEFHRAVLPEYLAFGYLSGADTFYQGIHKLLPGHSLEINESGELKIQQYWDPPMPTPEGNRDESYYVDTYRELLDQAVRSHLMSDVPLGVFLSGGLDSSAVAALMSRARTTPIETFSVGYSEQDYSELSSARFVAQYLKSNHREVLLSEGQFFDALPKLIWHEDEPIVWPSSVALYFVARLAHEHVKVVLTGEGSDETLGGYSRYAFTLRNTAYDRLYRRCLPGSMRNRVRDFISTSRLLDATLRRKLAHSFLARDGQSWESFYFDNFLSTFGESELPGLFHGDLATEFKSGASYSRVLDYWQHSSGGLLGRLLYTDIKTYLVELLMKQDNMSMAASIESRVPFLDHKLVEFALQIPEDFQIQGLTGKRILKEAMRGLLPDSIIHRKKLGFPTPWRAWLAGPRLNMIQSLLSEERTVERLWFKPATITRLFSEHGSGYRDHSDRIWRLLNLEVWYRVCVEHDFQ